MAKGKSQWKRGRGKLGPFAPLIGEWKAAADSPMGPIACSRTFAEILKGSRIQLTAVWDFGAGKRYEEIAIIGPNSDGAIAFWSFTSDGKMSQGLLADVTDVHPEAIGFEAQMPAGLARMVYWPDGDGFCWAVESKTKKGWNRFTLHRYRRASEHAAEGKK